MISEITEGDQHCNFQEKGQREIDQFYNRNHFNVKKEKNYE